VRTLTVTLTVIAIVASFVLIAIATTIEGAFAILFGWIPFLLRVLPEVKPDGPSVLLGAAALLLFGVGVHCLGRSWRGAPNSVGGRWRVRWTVAVVLSVMILFTAGISVIGMTHQVAWLATSEKPIVGEGLNRSLANVELNAKMIGLGLANYESVYGILPPGGTFSANGEMRHSWETHILPWMGYSTSEIDMNRPWNGPENQKYFRCVLPDFINPAFRTPTLEDGNGFGLSHYAANSRVLTANKSMKLTEITNGASNTILIGEVNTGFKPWGHPVNWRDPAVGLNRGANSFGGPTNINGATFLMADGSVRFLGNGVDPGVLRSLSNPRADD
jgi:hypothetical protein